MTKLSNYLLSIRYSVMKLPSLQWLNRSKRVMLKPKRSRLAQSKRRTIKKVVEACQLVCLEPNKGLKWTEDRHLVCLEPNKGLKWTVDRQLVCLEPNKGLKMRCLWKVDLLKGQCLVPLNQWVWQCVHNRVEWHHKIGEHQWGWQCLLKIKDLLQD